MIETQFIDDWTIEEFITFSENIGFDPPYQREGNVWNDAMQSRFIDSILNRFDVPKIYWQSAEDCYRQRENDTFFENNSNKRYFILDGRQRCETILAFASGKVKLPEDFIDFATNKRDLAGCTYQELWERSPWLARRFLNFKLPIVVVRSSSIDFVLEMFQRLNSGSSLNAAEKRNAVDGWITDASRELSNNSFFVDCLPFAGARYKYRELSSKFLAIEDQMKRTERIKDTKAATLWKLHVRGKKDAKEPDAIREDLASELREKVSENLDFMRDFFEQPDRLLGQIGSLVSYYVLFRDKSCRDVNRDDLVAFEDYRRRMRRESGANNDGEPDPILAQLDSNKRQEVRRYLDSFQSTNDGSAIETRVDALKKFLSIG